jgi:hypothetical protein
LGLSGALRISSATYEGVEELEFRVTRGLAQLAERREAEELERRMKRID